MNSSIALLIFGFSLIYIAGTSRLEAYIKTLILQGLLLTYLVIPNFINTPLSLLLIISETFIFKTIVIPWFLFKLMRNINIKRETEPYFPNFYSIIIMIFILLSGFILAYWINRHSNIIKPFCFGIAFSTIATGFVIILSRYKLFTHILGFIIIENGIFLLIISTKIHLPKIVDIGILLDIFLVVLILGIFSGKVKSTFNEINIKDLKNLHD